MKSRKITKSAALLAILLTSAAFSADTGSPTVSVSAEPGAIVTLSSSATYETTETAPPTVEPPRIRLIVTEEGTQRTITDVFVNPLARLSIGGVRYEGVFPLLPQVVAPDAGVPVCGSAELLPHVPAAS